MKVKIGMILDSEYPHIRVELEAKALVNSGYKVYILCKGALGEPVEENINGIEVVRVITNSNISKLGKIINSFIFYNPLWGKAISKFIDTYKIDILHIHNLPLAGTGIKIAKEKGIPVIIDLHENYPAAYQVWFELVKGLKGFLIRNIVLNYQRWTNFEAIACKRADKIITVVEEMKERIKEKHKLDEDKIIVITNTEEKAFVNNSNLDYSLINRYKSKFVISYIGGFGPHRGVDTAIKGMPYIKDKIPNLLLLLVGKGSGEIEEYYRTLVKNLKLEDSVEFVGWQPFNKVYTYICLSNICIVPHNKNEHTDHTVPYKLFQYMMVGKPVIVSDCKPLKRIVEEIGSGLIFKAGDPSSFAEKVLEIYKNPKLGEEFGERGKEATLYGIWNWEETSKSLIKLYSNPYQE